MKSQDRRLPGCRFRRSCRCRFGAESPSEVQRGFFLPGVYPDGGWFKLSVPATENPRISKEFLEWERRDTGERFSRNICVSFKRARWVFRGRSGARVCAARGNRYSAQLVRRAQGASMGAAKSLLAVVAAKDIRNGKPAFRLRTLDRVTPERKSKCATDLVHAIRAQSCNSPPQPGL